MCGARAAQSERKPRCMEAGRGREICGVALCKSQEYRVMAALQQSSSAGVHFVSGARQVPLKTWTRIAREEALQPSSRAHRHMHTVSTYASLPSPRACLICSA